MKPQSWLPDISERTWRYKLWEGNISSMSAPWQPNSNGFPKRRCVCVCLYVCLIWPLPGHYPDPLLGCQPACQKQLASAARSPVAATLAIKKPFSSAHTCYTAINTSILALILYHHESLLTFSSLRGSLFILAKALKPAWIGPCCWQGV